MKACSGKKDGEPFVSAQEIKHEQRGATVEDWSNLGEKKGASVQELYVVVQHYRS